MGDTLSHQRGRVIEAQHFPQVHDQVVLYTDGRGNSHYNKPKDKLMPMERAMKPLALRSPVTVLMALAIVGIALAAGWFALRPTGLPLGFASSNGRIEAVEIDIAAISGALFGFSLARFRKAIATMA